jgi:hypothetical protein
LRQRARVGVAAHRRDIDGAACHTIGARCAPDAGDPAASDSSARRNRSAAAGRATASAPRTRALPPEMPPALLPPGPLIPPAPLPALGPEQEVMTTRASVLTRKVAAPKHAQTMTVTPCNLFRRQLSWTEKARNCAG